jgi:hypothetical protein
MGAVQTTSCSYDSRDYDIFPKEFKEIEILEGDPTKKFFFKSTCCSIPLENRNTKQTNNALNFLSKFHNNVMKAQNEFQKNADLNPTFMGTLIPVLDTPFYHHSSLKMLGGLTEKNLWIYAKMGAIKSYYDLLNTTPAYKKFIESYGGQINSWVDIPPMSKNNYVKKYPVRELHKDGIIPIGGGSQTDTSTGTSGTPTIWYRSKNELDYIQNMLILTADIVVGFNTDIYLINMFALGKYATGMTVSRCLRDRFSVFNCGPDFDAAIRFIIATEKEREKPGTYIVAGYPPHMLEFVDLATQQGIDFSKISLFIVCGGESMSIHTRQNIEKYGVKLVISTYGASDLDINVAGQNIFDKVLGDVIKKDPSLLVDLAGKSVINKGTPAVFHFNPLYYYIENDLDGNLYFTSLNDKRSSGRVKYCLEDIGCVIKAKKVRKVLKKHHYDELLKLHNNSIFPTLLLYGRYGTQLTFIN